MPLFQRIGCCVSPLCSTSTHLGKQSLSHACSKLNVVELQPNYLRCITARSYGQVLSNSTTWTEPQVNSGTPVFAYILIINVYVDILCTVHPSVVVLIPSTLVSVVLKRGLGETDEDQNLRALMITTTDCRLVEETIRCAFSPSSSI